MNNVKPRQVALILTIPSEDYQDAKEMAQELVAHLSRAGGELSTYAATCQVVQDYETDNKGRRMVYLSPVDPTPDADIDPQGTGS